MRVIVSLLLLLLAIPASAQISYHAAFPNAVHHEAEITVTIKGAPDGPLSMRMSRTSPGRYSLHEFAKNVYNVRAMDSAGNDLEIFRPNPHQWDVLGHDGIVILKYTLYADRADGTYSQIDNSHAHLNIPATFMFARDHADWPISITFEIPENADWKIATQLFPTENPTSFTAPDLHYFMDSPTLLSDFSMRTWLIPQAPGSNETYQIRLAVNHLGTETEVDEYADMVRRIVEQQNAVFGGPPAFDGGTYTFIASYLPWASGDGMEHRNSTILSSSSSLASNAIGLLGTVSHEYFHAWNVERLRPASLEPFDFEAANMSPDLWFAEGFTSYYTPLFIRRAEITSDADYARSLTGSLNTVINSPGRKFFSPFGMSMRAPFVDRASAYDPVNFSNTFISYYTWGAMVGLNLDLTLRKRGVTLDDFMLYLWELYGIDEIPYSANGIEQALGAFLNDVPFANQFFDQYVKDSKLPDYESLLAQAGFLLRPRNSDQAYIGPANLDYEEDGAVIRSNTIIGSPLYEAGLDRGDKILKVDGKSLTSSSDWQSLDDGRQPGDTIEIEFEQRGQIRTAQLTLIEDPRVEVVLFEDAGRSLTEEQKKFREAWLGAR